MNIHFLARVVGAYILALMARPVRAQAQAVGQPARGHLMSRFAADAGLASKAPVALPRLEARGADLSLLQTIEDAGVKYKDGGRVQDPLLIFKNHGWNFVRLRLFVAPDGTLGQVNTPAYTLKLAKRVKAAGLKFTLDFHYSDSWADPGHQIIPVAWKDLSHAQLVQRVHDYTRDCLLAFARAGCAPDLVSVGNEVRAGMMWPAGGPLTSEAKWDDFAALLRAGIAAVRETAPRAAVMIHTDSGGDKAACRWFFDHLQARHVEFDVIGLSYYPFWQGTLADLAGNLASLSATYGKDIFVAETAYDTYGGDQEKLPFPITPDG